MTEHRLLGGVAAGEGEQNEEAPGSESKKFAHLAIVGAGRRGLGCFRRLFAVGGEQQNGGAGDGDAARDAVMACPGTVLVLQFEELGLGVGIPLLPRLFAKSLGRFRGA